MSVHASIHGDWTAGFAAACDRLVHPTVADARERLRQSRLVGVALAGPFVAAAAMAQALAPRLDASVTMAAACAVLVAGWLVACGVIFTAGRRVAEPAALVAGVLVAAVAIAAAGGAASPLAILAAALPVESAWVARSARAARAGAAAGLAGLAGAGALVGTGLVPLADTGVSAWHWALPLVYGLTLWPRLAGEWTRREEIDSAPDVRPLEQIVDAAVLRMNAAGDVSEASPQVERLLGLAPDMLLGTAFFERMHVADRVGYLNALADLREGAERRSVPLRLRLPGDGEGSTRFGNFAAELAREDDIGGIVAIVRDDSAAAELRTMLAQANDRADSTEAAKSRFLAAVSHELRTPLNAILGFSHILEDETLGGVADGSQREYVRLIGEAGGHLLSVVNMILDVSKIESDAYEIRPEPFRFEEAANLCVAMMAQQATAKNVTTTLRIGRDVGEVCFDRRAVQQVLINLLSNAIKFTPAGGAVTVSGRRGCAGLEFEVSDTGIGIAADDLARIGTPFVQVRNDYTKQYEGTGLGLALVKGLVELQGGAMTIASAPGAGTAVTITLPIAEAEIGEESLEQDRETACEATTGEWIDEAARKTA